MRIRILTPIADGTQRMQKVGWIVTWGDNKDAKRLIEAGYAEHEFAYISRQLKEYGITTLEVPEEVANRDIVVVECQNAGIEVRAPMIPV